MPARPSSTPPREWRRSSAGSPRVEAALDEVLLIAIGIGWAVGTPILAIVALVRTGGLRAENARLAAEIAALRRQIEQGVVTPSLAAAPEPEPAPVQELPPPFEPTVTPPPVPVWEPQPPQPSQPSVGWDQRLGA